MLGRRVHHTFALSSLLLASVVSACAQTVSRGSHASVAASTGGGAQSAGGDLAPKATLTLSTPRATTAVDARDDSATARAITKVISTIVPELSVEASSRGNLLRLRAQGKLGDYSR